MRRGNLSAGIARRERQRERDRETERERCATNKLAGDMIPHVEILDKL